jgi:formylglycine-generating enzyme required for sulfatase activity
MGSPVSEEGRDSDEVQHTVTLTRAFWLGKTEVTQGEWRRVMGTNPSRFSQCGDSCPVDKISWEDAVAYCNARSRQEGLEACYDGSRFRGLGCTGYRLPTEAEWEYAARAGTTGARYGDLDAIGWYDGNSGGTIHAGAQRRANAWGLHDMLGNVWEWTNDWHGADGGDAMDPTGAVSGERRVLRGGGWNDEARYARVAFRYRVAPAYRFAGLGLRTARSVP